MNKYQEFWTTGLHTSFWLFSLIYDKIQISSQINCPIILFCNEDPKVIRTFQSEIRFTAESPDQKYLEHVLLYPWRLPPFPACWLIPVGHSAQVFHHPLPSQDSHGGNKGRKRASPPPTLSPRPLSVSTLNLPIHLSLCLICCNCLIFDATAEGDRWSVFRIFNRWCYCEPFSQSFHMYVQNKMCWLKRTLTETIPIFPSDHEL